MGFTPLAFSGISSYSADLQTVLNRAVKIAALPLQQLQNESADILGRKTQLGALANTASSLASALENLGKVSRQKALSASSSNTDKVAVTYSGATTANSYPLNSITSLASQASETSTAGFASSTTTAVSSTGLLKLKVGTAEHNIDISATNNLTALRDAINGLSAGVTASILTTGATSNYLSITANSTGATTLQLIDAPTGAATNLLTAGNQGSDAVFKLNNIDVTRKNNVVNDVIPGVSFTLLDDSTTPVTLTLSTQRASLATALDGFARGYNAAVDALGAQIGPAAGLLSGDFTVREIQKALREIASHSGSGAIDSLSDLGLTFDKNGRISIDATVLGTLSESQVNAAFDFIGSETNGLGALSGRLSQIGDPLIGLVKLQQEAYDKADVRVRKQIADLETRLTELQRSVASRLQSVDALLGSLEAQQKLIDASYKGVSASLFGKAT